MCFAILTFFQGGISNLCESIMLSLHVVISMVMAKKCIFNKFMAGNGIIKKSLLCSQESREVKASVKQIDQVEKKVRWEI